MGFFVAVAAMKLSLGCGDEPARQQASKAHACDSGRTSTRKEGNLSVGFHGFAVNAIALSLAQPHFARRSPGAEHNPAP
jgi:hypothetical protein